MASFVMTYVNAAQTMCLSSVALFSGVITVALPFLPRFSPSNVALLHGTPNVVRSSLLLVELRHLLQWILISTIEGPNAFLPLHFDISTSFMTRPRIFAFGFTDDLPNTFLPECC
jgi:hypothetical protein